MVYARSAIAGLAVLAGLTFVATLMMQSEATETLGANAFPAFLTGAIVVASLGWKDPA